MRFIAAVMLLILVTSTDISFAGYGDKTNGLPNWQERAILVLTNACRMSPVPYRDAYVGAYTILLPENYPAVRPLYWNLALNTSARFHAMQMADTCGMTHNSCNGESFSTRVQKYYNNKSYTIGEDIATGYATPQATMKQWIMDATNNVPAVDLSMCGTARCDGHRANIMSKGYREMGTGYDSGAIQYKYFWCQDLGGGKPEFNNPVVSGAHLFIDAGKTTFMANFFDSIGKPLEALLYVDNQKTVMTLLMGADSAGTYAAALTKGSACRYYYFAFTDSKGKAWRYPETGYLVTQGEGACARDFVPPESLSVGSVLKRISSGNRWINLSIRCNILTICINDASKDILQSSIFDANGRLLFTALWSGNKTFAERTAFDNGMVYRTRIDHSIPHGIYFVQNRFADGTIVPLKLEIAGHD